MIRDFRTSDAAKIKELGQDLLGSFNLDNVSSNERLKVYEKDGRVLGFIDYIRLYEVVEILYIVVEKDYRRQGIGRELISHILDGDCNQSILEVRVSNEEAIRFYQSLGYRPIRTIKNYCSNGEDAIAMEKVKE